MREQQTPSVRGYAPLVTSWPELERTLCRIPHVTSARVVPDGGDTVRELHIVATLDKPAKQVVRDVQSVAMASFGVTVDRNVVSVVQLDADDQPSGARAPSPAGAAMVLPVVERTLLAGMTLRSSQGLSSVSVMLRWNGREVEGSASRPATGLSLHRLAAEATLDALGQLRPDAATGDIDSVEVRDLGSRQVALVSVARRSSYLDEVLVGTARVRAAGELDAVARAVLDATNRRLVEQP